MKKVRLIGVTSSWVLTMPNILYFFFKKFVHIKSDTTPIVMQGKAIDVVYFDEIGSIDKII